LYQPWSLDNESPRLQEAEKKKYYELRKERCERAHTHTLTHTHSLSHTYI